MADWSPAGDEERRVIVPRDKGKNQKRYPSKPMPFGGSGRWPGVR